MGICERRKGRGREIEREERGEGEERKGGKWRGGEIMIHKG
jgi:hypothetical protein